MIVEAHGKVLCLGCATFRNRFYEKLAAWGERLFREAEARLVRLSDVQHLLCKLVETLDPLAVHCARQLVRA